MIASLHPSWLFESAGAFYAVVSGWLADITLVTAAVAVYRKHQCHQRWCWRFGKHAAGEYVVCRRHHPTIQNRAPTAAHIAKSHQEAQ